MDKYGINQNRRQPLVLGLMTAAMLGLSVPALGGAGLTSHGPINQFGYPSYYTDANGVSIYQATDFNDPFLVTGPEQLQDRAAPLDVRTGNFYDETFYFWSEAIIFYDAPRRGRALVTMVTEGVFAGPAGAVIQGDQAVMGRMRVRVDIENDVANIGTYTIYTPYGNYVREVTLADLGKNHAKAAINFTIDSISMMGANERFTTPFDPNRSEIGPTYLRWDSGAPAGYLGDPNIPHTVTGSPIGQNFFRVEGPNIGGPGINFIHTDLIGVAGQIVPPDQVFVDLNGNEINDAQDIASGLSRDCNANGIPDSVDLVSSIEIASPQMITFGAGFPQSTTIPAGTPRANTPVSVGIVAVGDFASPLEGATLDLNGIFLADILFNTGHDCATGIPDVSEVIIDSVTYDTIVGLGDAVFTLTPSAAVNPDYCGTGTSYATINVQFKGVSPLDLNQDGIIDSCAAAPLLGPQPRPEIDRKKRKRNGHKK